MVGSIISVWSAKYRIVLIFLLFATFVPYIFLKHYAFLHTLSRHLHYILRYSTLCYHFVNGEISHLFAAVNIHLNYQK